MQVIDTEYTLLINERDNSLLWQVFKHLVLRDLRAHTIWLQHPLTLVAIKIKEL